MTSHDLDISPRIRGSTAGLEFAATRRDFRGARGSLGGDVPFCQENPGHATRETTVTQSEVDLAGLRLSSRDVWLQWPDTYRPECPVCMQPTIGLVDRGRYVQRTLRLTTVAEPCGCDVSDHAQAIQVAAAQAGAIS